MAILASSCKPDGKSSFLFSLSASSVLFAPLVSSILFLLLSPFCFCHLCSHFSVFLFLHPLLTHSFTLFLLTSLESSPPIKLLAHLLFFHPHRFSFTLSLPSSVLLSLLPPPLICSPGSGPAKLPVLQSDGDRVQNLITHWLTARTTC